MKKEKEIGVLHIERTSERKDTSPRIISNTM